MKNFDVMFTADSKYLDIMLASIYSFLLNSNLSNIRVHIIASNFSKKDYKKSELIIKEFTNTELYFYPFENFNIKIYNLPNWRGGQISNARLFFQDILTPNILKIENLLYLDSDTITISELTELKNYKDGLYACTDAGLSTQHRDLPNINTYYNSGVIFINVNEWTTNNYQDKIINFLENNNIKLDFPDQDVFNCSLSENIKQLPINYNLPPHAYAFNKLFTKLYFNPKRRSITNDDIVQAKQNPKIIHSYGFSGIKPWHGNFNPFYDEYMKYILKVNPYFKAEELDNLKKLMSKFPHLYRSIVLIRNYIPKDVEKHVKKLALKCQQKKTN